MEERLQEEYELRMSADRAKLTAEKALARVEAQLRQHREEDPRAQEVREVLQYWRETLEHPKATLPMDGKRADIVRKALKTFDVKTCKKAIRGLSYRRYVAEDGRTGDAQAPGARLFDEIRFALGDEERVEKCLAWADEHDKPPEGDPELEAALALAKQAMTPPRVDRLHELRGWDGEVVRRYELGVEGGRVVLPARDERGTLVGLTRYAPNPAMRNGHPKTLAQGSRELFPRPEQLDGEVCWLCEGESDTLAALSSGLPACGVPGVGVWQDRWARRFARFEKVVIVFDADDQGRTAARERALAVRAHTSVSVLDLAPDRSDSYDLTDYLGEHDVADLVRLQQARAVAPPQPKLVEDQHRPMDRVREALERLGRDAKPERNQQYMAQCPAHPDDGPSLSVKEVDAGRVLLHCFAGCETEAIIGALGLTWADLGGT